MRRDIFSVKHLKIVYKNRPSGGGIIMGDGGKYLDEREKEEEERGTGSIHSSSVPFRKAQTSHC